MIDQFEKLKNTLQGDLLFDETSRILYATDASVYRELPLAVILPKTPDDIKHVIQFANENKIGIIPRATGTSLAGQVVGNGIVVDISRYMTDILEINEKENWVRVQPGINLDELNRFLLPNGLFFAPETSTSKSCRIGGMVGNNSAGSHSLVYHTTREHVISLKAILSDGSDIEFKPLSIDEFHEKRNGTQLENKLYQQIWDILSDPDNQKSIRDDYPHPSIIRRNTGYALDVLLDSEVFTKESILNLSSDRRFNLSKLITGSEGTLAFVTEIKLNLVPLPPNNQGLLCAHFNTISEAIQANLIALDHNPRAIELIDKTILDCAKENINQLKNRYFIKDDPGAILVIELAENSLEELNSKSNIITSALQDANLGYYFPLLTGENINKVWALRKAGLGVLSNIPGDKKPVAVVEDTSVPVYQLENYIKEFNSILDKKNLSSVYYAHISVGELHLRPVLNLKKDEDIQLFRYIAENVALLVKKYNGSLSGEHGDGRVRGEFIPIVLGNKNFELIKKIKNLWDPNFIFNPGKIVNPLPMHKNLRYEAETNQKKINTIFDFKQTGGIISTVEKCNGVGDCRKSHIFGGTMCPTYMATKDEFTTTRARSNVLRDFLLHSTNINPFHHQEIFDILDLCLSCKGCKSECPSNVDMAKLKSEFLYQYYKTESRPLPSYMIANIVKIYQLISVYPSLYNGIAKNNILSNFMKNVLGFSQKRSIPLISNQTLSQWLKCNLQKLNQSLKNIKKTIYLFVDEVIDYNESHIGIKSVLLLHHLGYEIKTIQHKQSGRIEISKGFLKEAKKLANHNFSIFSKVISSETPLIGIEPSCILTFRDEYPDLVDDKLKKDSNDLLSNVFMIDEFIAKEWNNNNIDRNLFKTGPQKILFHGHCQQKSIADTKSTKTLLTIPEGHQVEEIPSGCCGMAGVYGYEKKHYDLSMKIGELVLFPAIRKADKDTLICATGSSCRQQIKDGTGVIAYHPAEILYSALVNQSNENLLNDK